jgi:uncharacterized membrane protein HdeD (DUF308 family)
MFANLLSRYWEMTFLRGAIWMLFGILIFMRPGLSLVTFTYLFGMFALVDGIASIVTAFGGREENDNWWVLLLMGLAGIGVAALTFIYPGVTALVVLVWIAAWAMTIGVLEIVVGIWFREEIEGEIWLILAGVASVAFGAFLFARPSEGLLSVMWLIAGYAFLLGLILMIFAVRARRFANRFAQVRG